MGTALSFYELTTWNPSETHIAIQRGRKVVLPDYPPIKLYHITTNILTLGRTEVKAESGQMIAIYDRERVVCDAVRYRNKIGIDIMKEVLKSILQANKGISTPYTAMQESFVSRQCSTNTWMCSYEEKCCIYPGHAA